MEGNLAVFADGDLAWNARDLDGFLAEHADDMTVRRPLSPDPVRGSRWHARDMFALIGAFPDLKIGPLDDEGRVRYKELFGSGDWVTAVRTMRGTHAGELHIGGAVIPPTGRVVEIELCTVARFADSKIVEERQYYDALGLVMDLGAYP